MTINETKFEIALARQSMTKKEIAERAGMSRGRLAVILNSKKVTPIAVGRIATALNVDATEIID